MKASVIIPTYNGAETLGSLLNALAHQTRMDFEVIVVVDGSTDKTEDVLRSYAERLPGLTFYVQRNAGRSSARNIGARKAMTDLLIFYDDDVLPARDSIAKHLEFHANRSAIMCGNAVEEFSENKTDVQNYRAWLSVIWTSQYPQSVTEMRLDRLFFTAANCSMPRNVFSQLKGFNEELRDAEDYELAYRAIEAGVSVYYDKSNHSIHNDTSDCRSYIRRVREYLQAHKKVNKANSDQLNSNFRQVMKLVAYRVLAFPFWPRLVDAGFFVRFMPRALRYRLYSAIIHSLTVVQPQVRL